MSSVYYPSPVNNVLLAVKIAVDNGILKHLGRKNKLDKDMIPKIDISTSWFPVTPDRVVKESGIIGLCGTYFFIIGPVMTFSYLL